VRDGSGELVRRACGAVAPGAAARRGVRTFALLISTLLVSAPLAAQRTAPSGVRRAPVLADTIADSLKHPPIAPRRAMIYSMLLPGFAQSRLNRPTSSIVFATFEILSLGMARKAALDLREARAARQDSVPTGFVADTVAGTITPTGYTQNRLVARIGARRTHYEDWLAAIIFNHVISGADAYVAANLWDFKANVAVTPTRNGAALAASIAF
jgi:hypothetical protein